MAADAVEPAVRLGEWFVVVATILGPVLAVQAQKWLERRSAKNALKEQIFRTLMATRAAKLSHDHVQALNMIDIAYYGSRYFGFRHQSKSEKAVSRAWHEYFDVLDKPNPPAGAPEQGAMLFQSRIDKFNSLLAQVAIAQGYDFESIDLQNRRYSPEAHSTADTEWGNIRTGLAGVLNGTKPIPMHLVTPVPAPAEDAGTH